LKGMAGLLPSVAIAGKVKSLCEEMNVGEKWRSAGADLERIVDEMLQRYVTGQSEKAGKIRIVTGHPEELDSATYLEEVGNAQRLLRRRSLSARHAVLSLVEMLPSSELTAELLVAAKMLDYDRALELLERINTNHQSGDVIV